MKNLIEQLRELFLPVIESEGVEFIDLEVKGKIGQHVIKVYVDELGGITLDKCVTLSRKFSDRLDTEDLTPGKYRLEVSSPGVNRPLKTTPDFSRNSGKEVKVIYEEELKEQSFEGTIIKVLNEAVQIQGKREIKEISISNIKFCKIKLPW